MKDAQIEALKRERQKIRKQSLSHGIQQQYHSISKEAQINKKKSKQLNLSEALEYINHLEGSNRKLHQQLDQQKSYYQNQIKKLHKKIKFKNQLLDQCQREIGHIKKQYSLVVQCQEVNKRTALGTKQNKLESQEVRKSQFSGYDTQAVKSNRSKGENKIVTAEHCLLNRKNR